MREKTITILNARTQFTRLFARVERIVIARAGKAVPELQPALKEHKRFRLFDDPLLRVEGYSYDGPFGSTANEDIDRTVYGPWRQT